MRGLRTIVLVTVLASVAALTAGPLASGSPTGFDTAKAPYVTPAAPGVKVDAILSTGDVIGNYQMSGIPDGLGAYTPGSGDDDDNGNRSKVVVVMNHELGSSFPGQPPDVDSRISRVVIDAKTRKVHDAEYLFTGNEGFERFCSSTLATINGRPLYFTGEEAVDAGHDGSSIVMDPETGAWRETPHFGRLQHENIVPLKLKRWVFLTSEDDFRAGQPSYVYAWIGKSANGSIRGRDGSLYVWKADDAAETGNATVVKGEAVPGHFVPIPQTENATSAALKAAAQARGAFKFDRLEDIAARPDRAGRSYIADTGKLPATERGRIYQFDVNRRNPLKATLKLILDADAGDAIVNPDNMAASSRVLVIQEDREGVFRDAPNRVLVYRFSSKTIATAALVTTPPPYSSTAPNIANNAESSGVIDASRLLGRNWWLLDVQAHNKRERQPGTTLLANSAEGEDGQLLALYIPSSTSGDDD